MSCAGSPRRRTIFLAVSAVCVGAVIIDNATLEEITRVGTGSGPDGDGWDPKDQIVAT